MQVVIDPILTRKWIHEYMEKYSYLSTKRTAQK